MQEYIVILPTNEGEEMLQQVPWMLPYLLTGNFQDSYDDALYQCWCYPLDEVDALLNRTFQGRYDYRCENHLHTLYNELTKEIAIIIINRYQIILKCDKIPFVVIKTIRNYYPNLRLFCRDREFEEVSL